MGREARLNNKLTRKQNTFVNGILNGQSATQAAMAAYDVSNTKTASVIASQNLSKLSVSEALEEALSPQGLTLDVIAGNIGNLANSKPEKVSSDAVLKANVELLKLHGAYPDKKSYQFSVSARADIKSMTFQEAKTALGKLNQHIDELLTEAQ